MGRPAIRHSSGDRFGRLVVLGPASVKVGSNFAYDCKCDCGVVRAFSGSALRGGRAISCGCKRREGNPHFVIRDLVGRKFGRLTVGSLAERDGPGNASWNCNCDCGNTVTVRSNQLVTGKTASCGCLRDELRIKHGLCLSRTYNSWCAMIQRCTNPRAPSYPRYGGRGIKICDRWRDSFESFLADMGERPARMTLDRYPNNDGNYEPGNCRWATRADQNRNRVQYPRKGIPRPRRVKSTRSAA